MERSTMMGDEQEKRVERKTMVWLGLAALALYWLYGIAWPLSHGRDFGSYISYCSDIFNRAPAFPDVMLHRTPLTPLLLGALLKMGVVALEIACAVSYVTAIVCVYLVARRFARKSGIVAAVCLMLYPATAALFRMPGSDSFYCVAFLIWAVALFRLFEKPTLRAFALHGVWIFLLVMIKPASQVYQLAAVAAFLIPGMSIKQRVMKAAALLLTLNALLALFSSYNLYRYDYYGITRGSASVLPFTKVYSNYHIVRPENGPATLGMAEVVESKLLCLEPYKSLGVTRQQFFEHGDPKTWYDMKELCDEVYGWDSNYAVMRKMAIEAILAHPGIFINRTAQDLVQAFTCSRFQPEETEVKPEKPFPKTLEQFREEKVSYLSQKPKFNFIVPVSHYSVAPYEDPVQLEKMYTCRAKVVPLIRKVPYKEGNKVMANLLNQVTSSYPGMIWCLLAGVIGLFLARPVGTRPLCLLVTLALISVTIPYVCVNTVLQYRVTFDPVFIMFGAIGVLAMGSGVMAKNAPAKADTKGSRE